MEELPAVLGRARELGFLGPGEPGRQIEHALAFARAWGQLEPMPPAAACDLGAGGGVPGLVLAREWPSCRLVLLEAGARRCAFLREAIERLRLEDRVEVAEGRAEELARGLDATFDAVTSRSFGAPAVVAECAARLLAPRGVLLVAEPPEGDIAARWPTAALQTLGFGPAALAWEGPRIAATRRVADVPDRFPRRVGVPAKRPLF